LRGDPKGEPPGIKKMARRARYKTGVFVSCFWCILGAPKASKRSPSGTPRGVPDRFEAPFWTDEVQKWVPEGTPKDTQMVPAI
jgi:hypothetical protein